MLDCYPLRYKNENGELLNPATGWLLDILITLCNEGGCEGEAPPDALELPLNRLFERVSNETYTYADDDEEGEWMPYEEFRARLCEEEAADR